MLLVCSFLHCILTICELLSKDDRLSFLKFNVEDKHNEERKKPFYQSSVYNAGNPGSIPGLGRSPGERNGNPLQYSCLKNPIDRGGYSPWGCKQSDTTEQLHFHFHFSGWNKSALTSLTFCEHLSLKRKCVCVCVLERGTQTGI